ncbi:pupal cuticle protein Edg-84A-like [Teleopsis dalmanni]|uniref:pupal cuticle protein Edg-84A-like n=1 Tax=Teleopsis dalmanni TaxID=139649 RepID=UPI0018CD7B6B|nr:pupal cuticle protein Edg-84A-like [Teleopsis dalmanni]
MAFKFVVVLACVAVATAGLLPVGQERAEEYEGHPNYSFNYEVQDIETGDNKAQSETRDGDVVRGQYSLDEADGYRRIVEYSVEGESGFNAVVRREPISPKSIPIALPAPVKAAPSIPAPASVQKPKLALLSLPTYRVPELKSNIVESARAHVVPTVLHHAPAQALIQTSVPALHLAPTHYVHAIEPKSHSSTVVHHAPAHALVHAAPTVHYAPAAAHIVHHAPATTSVLRAGSAIISHHAPAVVKTSLSSPHISWKKDGQATVENSPCSIQKKSSSFIKMP